VSVWLFAVSDDVDSWEVCAGLWEVHADLDGLGIIALDFDDSTGIKIVA
jgi:hypothetical protein